MSEPVVINLSFVELEYELWALRKMLDTIEPAIVRLSEQQTSQILSELRGAPWSDDPAEIGFALQGLAEMRDYVLPRFMRGPFIVALWACFETSVYAVADQKRREGCAPIALAELQGRTFLERAKRYFKALLSMRVDDDSNRLERLADLYVIRSALAHANANREGMNQQAWADLRSACSRQGLDLDEDRGMLVLNEQYVRSAFFDVYGCLSSLFARARETSPVQGGRDA